MVAPDNETGGAGRVAAPDRDAVVAGASRTPAHQPLRREEGLVLTPGARVAHYRVVEPLGAGGMGEVYRARDERLDREVAIKVLPDEVANDADRLVRFEREAKALASLNHQNIASLYGLEEQEGQRFLVMELVEGRTLADRCGSGPLPIDEALAIARQIADGLETAHDQGIIHRDLKPENVMLSAEGRVKILDFGLAKAYRPHDSGVDLTQSPTMTAQMTAAGMLVGTAAFMSPEQARGGSVDRRADVWAFGCLLYEMITGRRLFAGDTVSDVLAGVLKTDIDLDGLPPSVPPSVRRLLARCLERDPARRLRDLGDAILDLDDAGVGAAGTTTTRREAIRPVRWAVALSLVIAAAVLAWRVGVGPGKGDIVFAEIAPPRGTQFVFHGDVGSPPVISRDESMVVFGAAAPGEPASLWVRSLRTGETRRLPGTEGGFAPFWSPDGRSIGFFDLTTMKRVDIAGGSSLTLCPVGVARGGVWTTEDRIIFAPDYNEGLHVVPATGGEPRPLTTLIQGRHTSHRWPVLLPDQRHVVYLAISHASPLSRDNELRLVGTDGRNDRQLVPSLASAAVAGDRLLFVREGALMAQRLDARRGMLSGEVSILTPDVFVDLDTWHGAFSAAGDILLYQTSPGGSGAPVTLHDMEGRQVATVCEPGVYSAIDASPDGHDVAVSAGSPSDIWVVNLESGRKTRLTFGPASATSPVWSADGSEIFYRSFDAESSSRILAMASSGAGDPRVLLEDPDLLLQPADASPDGRYLLLEDAFVAVGADIWIMDLQGDSSPRPLIQRPGTQNQATLSPDGRWLLYQSDESDGLRRYFVEPFVPTPSGSGRSSRSGRWEVSVDPGAGSPRWSSDGKKVLRLTIDNRLVSVDLDVSGNTVRVGASHDIGPTNAASILHAWDIVPGTDRIVLINRATRARAPLTAVIGLRRLLERAQR